MTVSIVFPQVSKNIEIQQQWEQKYSVSDCPALTRKQENKALFILCFIPADIISHGEHPLAKRLQKKSPFLTFKCTFADFFFILPNVKSRLSPGTIYWDLPSSCYFVQMLIISRLNEVLVSGQHVKLSKTLISRFYLSFSSSATTTTTTV